jgi:integrase
MASITTTGSAKARRYTVNYRDTEGRQRRKTFTRKGSAEAFASTVEADKIRGTFVDVSDRTTVAEYARRWAAARPHRPTTARRVSSLIETHLERTRLGSRRLASVLPSEVQSWATDRAALLAPSTLRNLVSLLRSIYASAVLDRLVASSPVVRVQLPRHERERVVPLTIREVQTLAGVMPRRNTAMVVTQAGLGLRIGELLALRVEDVNFLRRTVRIEWQFAPQSKVRTIPKTPRSRRTVPLPRVVADALAKHLEEFPASKDGTIFTTRYGEPYRHDYYGSIIFGAAVRTAGLPFKTTSHSLRHHYASVLLAGGESVVAVAERLGHENATLVLKTYGHLMPDSEDRTRHAVDEAWSRYSRVTSEEENALSPATMAHI